MNEIPLSKPDIGDLEINAVVSVLKSSRLSLGPKLEEFETRVATYISAPYAVAVSSGTAGLHLCLVAMGIGSGDEVLVPSFTFIAAANVVRYVGASPIFVDISPRTLNVNPAMLEPLITPATRAIIIAHTFGLPADMTAVLETARKHKLLVIEDACEAIGAKYHNAYVGSLADAGVFAFYPNKQITTGEGGMVVTKSRVLAREIRALRNHGRYESDAWHQHSLLGYNYRLSEISAALGCAQMERLDTILAKRAEVAERYDLLLKVRTDVLRPVIQSDGNMISWFVYVVRLPEFFARSGRDEVIRRMQILGIQCGRYFAPIHSQPVYENVSLRSPLPVTDRESQRTIALPFYSELNRDQAERVTQTLFNVMDLYMPTSKDND